MTASVAARSRGRWTSRTGVLAMVRSLLTSTLVGLIVATVSSSARAQLPPWYAYPPAYPPPLWLWPGSTIEGDVDRGMGVYLMGAGVYHYETAVAAWFHSERIRREDLILELDQRIRSRRYAQRKAE